MSPMRPIAFLSCVLTLLASPVHGQVRTPKWEVEVHGAFGTGSASPTSQAKTPGAGPTFTLGDGATPTRAVSSWYFGDGAALLNQVLALRGVTTRLTPLDGQSWPAAGRRPGPQLGARIARHVTGGVWLELSFDLALNPIGFAEPARDQIETTRAAFVSALAALADSTATLLPNPTITSTATLRPAGRQLVTSGVVHYRAQGPGARPYLVGGVGYAVSQGGPASLTLVGNYQLTTPGQARFNETDTVTLKYEATGSIVWIMGGGYTRDLSDKAGFRIDARLLLGSTGITALLSDQPAIDVTSPTGTSILNLTSPGLQFSTVLRTNLSGPAHTNFEAFNASTRTKQWVISAGYFRRF